MEKEMQDALTRMENKIDGIGKAYDGMMEAIRESNRAAMEAKADMPKMIAPMIAMATNNPEVKAMTSKMDEIHAYAKNTDEQMGALAEWSEAIYAGIIDLKKKLK